ncbi:MAG: hypothetical protein AAGB31_13760 [Bdellovibrio sp.]
MNLRSFNHKIILAALLLFSGFSAQAGWEVLHPANILERLQKEVAKQDISASVGLVNGEILEGISTSLKYRLDAEPSYVDGFYTRFDRYTLRFALNPGDYIDDLDSPVGMSLNKDSEILFARQFRNQKESLTALPYTMRNLPFTAEKAIEKLVPGDFVAFEGQLSVVLSLGYDALKGDFSAGASTHAIISGQFMVHLFRMPENKIRVKLISVRNKGGGVRVGADLSEDLEIFGVSLLDNRIERWLNFTPFDIKASLGNSDVVMLDYVFNLNNPEAADAYDQLMRHKVLLKEVKIINPAVSNRDLTKELLTDLTDIEELAMADSLLPASERRIDRIFKGTTDSYTKNARVKFGLNLWKFEAGRIYSQNKVLNYSKSDAQQYFLLDTLSRYQKTKIFFGLYGEETLMSSNVLFTANSDWNPERFIAFSTTQEMRIREVEKNDIKEAQRLVRTTIGQQEYSRIDWKNWNFNNKKVVNGYFKQEVFFNPDALRILSYLSQQNISEGFKKYIKEAGRPRSLPFIGSGDPFDHIENWVGAFTGDTRRVANRLAIVINPQKTIQERHAAFQELQNIPIWREQGMGFLMSYIPEAQRPDLLRYEMTLSAKGMPSVSYNYGVFKEEKLYRSLIYIQNILNNRSFDLRLYTQSNGEFSLSNAPLQ